LPALDSKPTEGAQDAREPPTGCRRSEVRNENSSRGVIIPLVLSIVLGSFAVGLAQRTGGYKEVAKDDDQVQAAAEFAVSEQGKKQETTYKLVSVEHAEQQVVAGLTSWTQEDCGTDEGQNQQNPRRRVNSTVGFR
jgi:hypothetical protein